MRPDAATGVTLQISLAPPDLAHVRHILPHQLRVWRDQVDEVLFTLDEAAPSGGRFAANWDEQLPQMRELLAGVADTWSARLESVDTSAAAMAAVGERFFATPRVPLKDSRGGPLYSYFYGLHAATHDRVLHVDSDMLFGGGSATWVPEALALLEEQADVVFASPLPGPPRADGRLLGQPLAMPAPGFTHAYRFPAVSTRVFLADRRRLRERLGPLVLEPPLLVRSTIKAWLKGNPPVAMPEQILSGALRRTGLVRVDFLGREPGMWSLHPPFRSPEFYLELPSLVARVERGDVPDQQRGHYDIVDALFDFSKVRARMARSPLKR